jgi:hypothetical protein
VRHGRAIALAFVTAWATTAPAADPPKLDFERDVRPILKNHCLTCHDGRKQKAALRLDIKSRALKGGESGKAAIVPGDVAKSELIQRVTSADAEQVMPPGDERLTAKQIQTLSDWITAGATWPDALAGETDKSKHWAFVPPTRPVVPGISNPKSPISNPIDCFVQARLAKDRLQPASQADRTTLIRRLSLDLLGLPPDPREVDAFVHDDRPNAYELLVERLLASPHYGERWGRHWLDAARFADSDGFEKDKPRPVWAYRDWVINAINRDLPYDRFVIEQLAGDLLPNATQDQVVATGYLRNSMINEEGGVDPEQFRMEAMFDRMDAIGKGMLGLTIQCAQCHDHKFDPISQAEYYRLFAFLNNDHEANVAVYTPDEQMRRADLFRQIKSLEDGLRHRAPDWRARMHVWEDAVRGNQPKWVLIRPTVDEISTGGQKFLPQPDGSLLAQGYAPTKQQTRFEITTNIPAITAFRLEILTDPNLPLGGPGRSIYGTGALSEFRVEAAAAATPEKRKPVKLVKATADVNPPETPLPAIYDDKKGTKRVTGPAAFAIDGNADTAWGFDVGPSRRNVPHEIVFAAEKPVGHLAGTALTFYLNQRHGGWNSDENQNHNLGRIRFSVTTTPGAEADPVPARVRAIIEASQDHRSPAEDEAVFAYWRTTVAEWKDANDAIEALWKQHPEGSSQLVLQARDQPRTTHMLKRGDFLKPDKSVTPGVPAVLNSLPADAAPNRLTFARWLVDRRSPTTARALVNRVWQSYFGVGLVVSSEDLGTQSEAPSHPELLDWLAVTFMDDGWSLKQLHRRIVTSATYRQSSRVTPDLAARDPDNRLLARGPRLRVDAEAVRDVALAAGGLLETRVGGRSVYPPLPGFMVLPPVSYGPKGWPEDHGPERYQRAIYSFRYRSLPYPVFQNFDAPNGDAACVRRARSNTPLQALTTLNEPLFVECARALALRTLRDGGANDAERLDYAFRRCVGRSPSAAEATELSALLDKQIKRFSVANAKPWDVAADDPAHPPELPASATPVHAAAWTAVARVLLNLDETITKE